MKETYIIINKRIPRLEHMIKKMCPDTYIIYSGIVFDMDCQSLRIRKHEDGELYMFGKKLRKDDMDYIDCHKFYDEIPEGRYIYMSHLPVEDLRDRISDARVIVISDTDDFEAYLATAIFLKTGGIDISRRIEIIRNNSNFENVITGIDRHIREGVRLPYFETEFAEIFEKRKAERFASYFPISRDIRYLQAETHMTNKEFAGYFGMSVRNVENWRKDPDSLKDFIYDLFEYKLLKEGVI